MTSSDLNFETMCNEAENLGAREALKDALKLFSTALENVLHSCQDLRQLKEVLAVSNISQIDWESFSTNEVNNAWCWSEFAVTFNNGRKVAASYLDMDDVKCNSPEDQEWLRNFLGREHFNYLPAFGYEAKIEVVPYTIKVNAGEIDCQTYSNYFFRLAQQFMNR